MIVKGSNCCAGDSPATHLTHGVITPFGPLLFIIVGFIHKIGMRVLNLYQFVCILVLNDHIYSINSSISGSFCSGSFCLFKVLVFLMGADSSAVSFLCNRGWWFLISGRKLILKILYCKALVSHDTLKDHWGGGGLGMPPLLYCPL